MQVNKLQDFNFSNKTVLLRVDINVPIVHGKIIDTSRIERIIPTIKYLINSNAKIVVISHFSRPKGKFVLDMSLAPIVDVLSDLLKNIPVSFAVDCIGDKAKNAVNKLNIGEVLLLENLRFYSGEEENNSEFAQEIAALGDIYVNDTFSCSHREHASIVGLPNLLPSAVGLLFQEEIENLENILTTPNPPVAAIIGGSKISTKLSLLYSLIEKSNVLVIGGGMANTLLKSKGYKIGASICEDDLLEEAVKILDFADNHKCDIILPSDAVMSKSIQDNKNCRVASIDNIIENEMILDIGPMTSLEIIKKLESCKTIIWNGPLGACEFLPFNVGTEIVARYIASLSDDYKSVAGGGDVVSAITNSGLKSSFSYLSTAGGAFLAWLEGKTIPGIKILEEKYQNNLHKKEA